jgi:hypothetical protein
MWSPSCLCPPSAPTLIVNGVSSSTRLGSRYRSSDLLILLPLRENMNIVSVILQFQSVRLNDKPLETHDHHFVNCVLVFIDLIWHPLWREDESVVYNRCWPSPEQSISGPTPEGLVDTFHSLKFQTRFLLLSNSYVVVDVGRSLWREDGSVIYICRWLSPAQSFSGPSPVESPTIFYCLKFEISCFVAS